VLHKPNKPDYSKPKAYRPISLLETFSKGLEAVVARRLSYLAETHRLLPLPKVAGSLPCPVRFPVIYVTQVTHYHMKNM
jgi:hypothetical protein